MPVFADQTVFSGIITLVTMTGVFVGIAVAIVHDYRSQHGYRSQHDYRSQHNYRSEHSSLRKHP